MTFHQATVRNNTSKAYNISVVGLPWKESDGYELKVRRVANGVTNSTYLQRTGQGNVIGEFLFPCQMIIQTYGCLSAISCLTNSADLTVPFPPNAQDLITVQKLSQNV